MKRTTHLALVLLAGVWIVAGTGCATQRLKEANRRLKESNDRLISENNRLEGELATLQKRLAEPPAPMLEPVVSKAANPSPIPADIADDLLIDDVVVSTSDDGIMFRIPNKVFFASGQATLSTRGQSVLRKVAGLINSQYRDHLVRVDGHTDDTPIRKVRNRFPTNWELSTARACSVVRFLVDKCDVDTKTVFPAGFSYYRPVTYGRSDSAKQQNRRVEITVLNKRV